MVLLENDSFLTELTKLFDQYKGTRSISLTMKKYDGRTKPTPKSGKHFDKKKMSSPETGLVDDKCLLRAVAGTKKLSTVVYHKDVNKFQMAYANLLKGNIDGLKKKAKVKAAKSKLTS